MRNLFLIVVLLGVVILAVGFLAIGGFPPNPHSHPVQKVLPNESFQSH